MFLRLEITKKLQVKFLPGLKVEVRTILGDNKSCSVVLCSLTLSRIKPSETIWRTQVCGFIFHLSEVVALSSLGITSKILKKEDRSQIFSAWYDITQITTSTFWLEYLWFSDLVESNKLTEIYNWSLQCWQMGPEMCVALKCKWTPRFSLLTLAWIILNRLLSTPKTLQTSITV